jgi:hypothetical protein
MASFQILFGKKFKHVRCYLQRIAQGLTISALKLESLMEAEIGRVTKETQPSGASKNPSQGKKSTIGDKNHYPTQNFTCPIFV